ncbi:hypothetical protein QR680_015786 [Steinernema hermaphroditum]|uniref:Serpentine Receptor, class T n=1 Tax=Steinernema hermaphroditum TaxID=289476 RepID=A0AA39H980_9BILA|nr:hypothetical protein QR680_015786 [Steinernema hermaphroditum]
MELYLFRPQEWDALYNCSRYHTEEEWAAQGSRNELLGLWYLITGILYMVPYIPCLRVMIKPDLIKHSCFKIMIFLGVIDFFCLGINGVLTGYLTIKGAVFCTYPNLIYIAGQLGLALWCMACMSCALLAFNRCVDVWRPKWMMFLFSEHRTFYWLLGPICYFFYFFFFTKPVLYTSKLYAWFFDPYFGTDDVPIERFQYMNFPHSINNISIVLALLTLYVFLSFSLWYKARIAQSEALSAMQRQIVIQSCTICAFDFLAAIIYVYMQFFETSVVFVVIGQMMWQASHGGAAIVYLSMNKTIRRGVLRMFIPKGDTGRIYASNTHQTVTHTTHSTH